MIGLDLGNWRPDYRLFKLELGLVCFQGEKLVGEPTRSRLDRVLYPIRAVPIDVIQNRIIRGDTVVYRGWLYTYRTNWRR